MLGNLRKPMLEQEIHNFLSWEFGVSSKSKQFHRGYAVNFDNFGVLAAAAKWRSLQAPRGDGQNSELSKFIG